MPLRDLNSLCGQLAQQMRSDPVGRGTARLCEARGGDCGQRLQSAAEELAATPGTVAIVTGFYVTAAASPAAETDGPPGALLLADLLLQSGADVCLITDQFGAPLLEAGRDFLHLSSLQIHSVPLEDPGELSGRSPRADAWNAEFLASAFGQRLTHLISIERAGPGHSVESIRASDTAGHSWNDFDSDVPPERRDSCHNMAGESIDAFTARIHRLFELVARQREVVRTIGIADGGNEIGFGTAPWSRLRTAIAGAHGHYSACRIPVDQLLVAGVSDWGAYALAAALCAAADRADLLRPTLVDRQRQLIEHIVRETNAVDGITGRREATVDSLKLEIYLDYLSRALQASTTG